MLSATHFETDLRAIEITITYGVAMNSLFGWWWLGGERGGGCAHTMGQWLFRKQMHGINLYKIFLLVRTKLSISQNVTE